ncbi:hypothetical protein ALCH109712_10120 [Alkalicoccus chagannorensis]
MSLRIGSKKANWLKKIRRETRMRRKATRFPRRSDAKKEWSDPHFPECGASTQASFLALSEKSV